MEDAFADAKSALAAHARNADRYADATEMAQAFLKTAESTRGDNSLVGVVHRFARWACGPARVRPEPDEEPICGPACAECPDAKGCQNRAEGDYDDE